MAPFPNVFEGGSTAFSSYGKKEKVEESENRNEKLEALHGQVDYSKLETVRRHILNIEKGLYGEEFGYQDKENGVQIFSGPRTSLVVVRNWSPLKEILEKELTEQHYETKLGDKNLIFSKIFPKAEVEDSFLG